MSLEEIQLSKFWNVYLSMMALQAESGAKLFWIQFTIMLESEQVIIKNTVQ